MNNILKYMIVGGLFVLLSGCDDSIAVNRDNDRQSAIELESNFVQTAKVMYMEYNYVSNMHLGESSVKSVKSTYPGENTKKPKDPNTYYISGVKYSNGEISSMKIEKSNEIITVNIDKSANKVMIVATNNTKRLVKELSIKDFMILNDMPLAK